MSGLFIAFEGVDGVGKSTQVAALRERFEGEGRTVLTVREPGGTRLGEAVREILLSRDEIEIGPEAQMLLFLASRVELWQERIEPALRRGEVVISDRYHLSTIVYQGIAGELGESRATGMCQKVLGRRRPDLNIVLELPLEIVRSRLGEGTDRFEREPEFLERVARGFASTRGVSGDRIARISGEGDAEAVASRVWEEVRRAQS